MGFAWRKEVQIPLILWARVAWGHFMAIEQVWKVNGNTWCPLAAGRDPRFIWMSNHLKNENKLLGQNGSVLLISDASPVPCLLKMCVSQKRVPMYPQHPARYEMRILCILCTGLRTMMILVSHILIIVRVSFVFDEESWQSTNWPWSCLSDRVMTLFWATLTSLLTGSHQRSSKSSQAWNLSRIRILSGGISPAQNLNWWDQRVFLRIKNLKAFSVFLVEVHPVESLTM